MKFEIRLRALSNAGESSRFRVADSVEDFTLERLCGWMRADLRLEVGGFGDDAWPVTVELDLPAFLADMPTVLLELQNGSDLTMSFPRLRRSLRASPRGEHLWIKTADREVWNPEPSSVLVERSAFIDQLKSLVEIFEETALACRPALDYCLPFLEWIERCHDRYQGPASPEGFRSMWTHDVANWSLVEGSKGPLVAVHEPSQTACLIENRLTSAVVYQRMLVAGVRVRKP